MANGGGSGLAALLWPVVILLVGIFGFLIGGYFSDNVILGLSLLVCTFGVYALGEAVLGAVFDVMPRLGGAILISGFCALAVALFYGYHLLVAE